MDFKSRLNQILNEDFIREMADQPNAVTDEQFLNFLNAIVTSSDQARADQAMARAKKIPIEKLVSAITRTEALGNISGLSDYIKAKPSRIMGLIELARIVFTGPELEQVVDKMIRAGNDTEVYHEEGDFYYDQGDDSDGH